MHQLAKFIFPLFLFVIATSSSAQESDQVIYQLAKQAESDGAYEIAISYYEKLYNKTLSDAYYNTLLDLYPKAEQFKEGEKMIKKRIKTYSKRAEYLVDLGYFHELESEEKEAKKLYDEALSMIDQNSMRTRLLANRFKKYEKIKWVEACYLSARKASRDNTLFQFELANTYAQQGRTSEMVDEYLTILGNNNGYIQTVQNLFQRFLHPDPEGIQLQMLKDQLLQRIQRTPNEDIFSELLIWLYVQEKNFKGAYIQAKALDRRKSENGKRLYNLALLSTSNKQYEVAENCFRYVLSLGDDSPYELSSKMKLVEVAKMRVLDSEYKQEDLEEVLELHEKTLRDLGKNALTFPVLFSQVDLYAYYLNQPDSAISDLEEMIEMPGTNSNEVARAKIALADILVIEDDIWEASLLYSQVEKDYKYDQLGETAKLKNAKIAYYTGDFYWAQAQLNVLKGSTSKLISNDAMDLSLLITDNIGLDSVPEPLQMFARADLLSQKRDYTAATASLDSITEFYPTSSLKDDILFFKYKMAFKQREYSHSGDFLRELIKDYGDDILGDDALFSLAKLEQEKLMHPEIAMDLYKQLITVYPASLFVVESRKRFRALRGDKLENQEIN